MCFSVYLYLQLFLHICGSLLLQDYGIDQSPEELCIYVLTWNVGASSPKKINLDSLLSLDGKSKCPNNEPDIFVIGQQEVQANVAKQITCLFTNHPWTDTFITYLKDYDYQKVCSRLMQGLLINVFAKSQHLPYIDNVESQKTGTGLGGFWGNKGAVSIRMNLYNGSVTFVNMHLAAHDGMMGKRLQQFTKILLYHNYETLHYIFDHDVVTIFGDLNFRIKGIDSSESIINKVKNKNLYELLERDELRILLEHNKIFQCLNEVCPQFSPTFKYKVGTQSYNRKRRPAWCDRILHRALGKQARCIGFPIAYGTFLKVKQLSYRSHSKYVQSDHKPVSAEFLYKMEKTCKSKYLSAEGEYIRPVM